MEHRNYHDRDIADRTVASCWPYDAEYDARATIALLLIKGARATSPVVVAPRQPLVFREWPFDAHGGGRLRHPRADWHAGTTAGFCAVALNGFDGQGFRLRYGAGYFDRTLAALSTRPMTLGVGFEIGRIPTIYPQLHDISMD